jgi:cytochrome c peroxidase
MQLKDTIFHLRIVNIQMKYCVFLLLIFISACTENTDYEPHVPTHFPELPIPEDNQLTASRVALGRLLFFDPKLSKDSTVACVSCHLPKFAFSDTIPLSIGVNGGNTKRNSPSLINVAYTSLLMKDGGVTSLEKQVISPLENPNEMGFQLKSAAERMAQNSVYQRMSMEAYDREFTPYVLVRALSAFQRMLIGGISKYDKYLEEGEKEAFFSASEDRGRALFFSERTNCSTCHSGVLFTNFEFENNGLHEKYTDVGRAGVSLAQSDMFKFRIPSLRNIELTAPYMFDGSLKTLEEVIAHYNSGGKNHYQKNELIRPLNLNEQEQLDLINFLKTLTDMDF